MRRPESPLRRAKRILHQIGRSAFSLPRDAHALRDVMSAARDERLIASLEAGLGSFNATRIRVAYSGGPDSVVLLHLLSRLSEARAIGLQAVHVDHRLHPESRDWARHCRRFCDAHGIALETLTVNPDPHRGRGPEEAARQARYAALAAGSGRGTVTATAHHREDLAETILMRLLRGSGPSGLAGIPPRRRFGGGWLWRPLLDVSRVALRDYARRHALPSVDDPSNSDRRLDRGFLREEVFPVLGLRWPDPAVALSRVAGHQRAALSLLEALAARDSQEAVDTNGAFSIDATREWPAARSANALRRWISERGLPLPGSTRLERIREEVIGARSDATPVFRWPGAELRRFRGRLYVRAPPPAIDARRACLWEDMAVPLNLDHGLLRAEAGRGRGLSARRVSAFPLTVRFRRGGERAQPSGRARSQTLKKLFQEYGVPPWERGRLPLLYAGDRLAAVAGLWICRGFEAEPGEPGWSVHWFPHAPVPPLEY